MNSAVFNRSSTRVVTASGDGTAAIWDVSTGKRVHLLTGHAAPVSGAVFDGPGARVATASADDTVRIWDARTGAELARLRAPGGASDPAFSPDGSLLLASCNRRACLWDISSRSLLRTFPMDSSFRMLGFDRSGKRVLVRDAKRLVSWETDGTSKGRVLADGVQAAG